MAIRPRLRAPRTAIISAVEIAYFRTFYKLTFNDLSDLNIFFGENDTGKSNVMRALNLFFNESVQDDLGFDFDVDFSTRRAAEAGGAQDVRKFAYVKLWFRTPAVHRGALGNEFYVKRTWSQTTLPEYRQESSSHIDSSGKQQSLTKFLNKIKFTYVPAVKDRTVYSNLLTSAYDAIAQTDAFEVALRTFTDEIRNQTANLSDRLSRSLGMESALSPPSDLGELFASLDFETLVAGGDSMSLIRQRGDGVQARHIPEIMAFIAERDQHPFHIWGIEEPENSLSINSALKLSNRLHEIAQERDMQIFLTTHSPTFYALKGAGVKKYFMTRAADGQTIFVDGTEKSTQALMEFMGDEFYLPLVAESVKAAAERSEELQASVAALEQRIVDHNRPILFVEGPSDAILVRFLLGELDPNNLERLEVVSLDGTSHAERISNMTPGLVQKLLHGRQGFVLLDSDKAGLSALPRQVDRGQTRRGWVRSNNSLYWRTIPPSDEARRAFIAAGIPNDTLVGVSIEDCYSSAVRNEATLAGAYVIGPPREFVHTKADLFSVSPALMDDDHKYYLREPADAGKVGFIRWLIGNDRARCEFLERILSDLLRLIPAPP
jgi:predicted ATPase